MVSKFNAEGYDFERFRGCALVHPYTDICVVNYRHLSEAQLAYLINAILKPMVIHKRGNVYLSTPLIEALL